MKGVPLWALGTNSTSPLFRLRFDGIELKVIRRHFKPYASLERVGVMRAPGTNNITLDWTDTRWITANVIRVDWLWDTVAFFARRNAKLTPGAQRFVEGPRPDLSRPG